MTAPRGRPPKTLCGLTAAQWSQHWGGGTPQALRHAQRVISGRCDPTPGELVAVAELAGVDLAELVRAVAELRTPALMAHLRSTPPTCD